MLRADVVLFLIFLFLGDFLAEMPVEAVLWRAITRSEAPFGEGHRGAGLSAYSHPSQLLS